MRDILTSDSSLWLNEDNTASVSIIDQRFLPFELRIERLGTYSEMINAIKDMAVRGAPLIGIASAYGLWLGAKEIKSKSDFFVRLRTIAEEILSARPTAVNPRYTLKECLKAAEKCAEPEAAVETLLLTAQRLRNEDIENCRMIGIHGGDLIKAVWEKKKPTAVNILTHCNAGWLACIKHGTATAPIYRAHSLGIPVHVWVDETRPRNQGSRLTAWELSGAGVPHTIITDNAGGHIMQQGMADMVIVGADRIALNGDVANKTGTYLKALAAKDNNIPFYVAAPELTIDRELESGVGKIPIEQRHAEEVSHIEAWINNSLQKVRISPTDSPVLNYGFDVSPARLIDAIITEKGVRWGRK